jgi:hypothetical protein
MLDVIAQIAAAVTVPLIGWNLAKTAHLNAAVAAMDAAKVEAHKRIDYELVELRARITQCQVSVTALQIEVTKLSTLNQQRITL